jgi:hypothetical protein
METVDNGLLSVDEAAIKLGVTPATLMTWRSIGKGPIFSRIGRRVFYSPADIQAWLATRKIDPATKGRAA